MYCLKPVLEMNMDLTHSHNLFTVLCACACLYMHDVYVCWYI
uniref:Uncharacterized protein n=1 Tax=Anguilla anguilla TaxID=7936 RepID=A0A0E9XBD3_ANGAN